jgi:hypothetical protein
MNASATHTKPNMPAVTTVARMNPVYACPKAGGNAVASHGTSNQ